MAGRLEGKVAVITGAASGIGAGTCRRFVDEGASVIVADIQDELGEALASELGDAARFVHCDVSSEDDVAGAVAAAVDAHGRLDVMFNNAGIVGAIGPVTDTEAAAWTNTIAIDLHSVFYGIKHAGRVMKEQRSGAIISTSSTAGILGGLGPHAYTAAKHAVVGLTKSVANEMAPFQVRVNAISPGNTVTGMTAGITGDPNALDTTEERIAGMSPLGYAGHPDDIANAALYLASDESRYVSGHTLVVDASQTTSGMVVNRFYQEGSSGQIHEAGRRS